MQTPNYDVNQGPNLCCKFTKNDALQSGPDRIRTLVSMATDSSHRVIMGKHLWPLDSAFIFDSIFLILAGNKDNHNIADEFKFQPDPITDSGVSCP